MGLTMRGCIGVKTHAELKDEQRLREIKETVEEQLDQLKKSKLKEWAIYR